MHGGVRAIRKAALWPPHFNPLMYRRPLRRRPPCLGGRSLAKRERRKKIMKVHASKAQPRPLTLLDAVAPSCALRTPRVRLDHWSKELETFQSQGTQRKTGRENELEIRVRSRHLDSLGRRRHVFKPRHSCDIRRDSTVSLQ